MMGGMEPEVAERLSALTDAERRLLVGEAEPVSRHFVLGQPCDGSKDCGVSHG